LCGSTHMLEYSSQRWVLSEPILQLTCLFWGLWTSRGLEGLGSGFSVPSGRKHMLGCSSWGLLVSPFNPYPAVYLRTCEGVRVERLRQEVGRENYCGWDVWESSCLWAVWVSPAGIVIPSFGPSGSLCTCVLHIPSLFPSYLLPRT
jgi:hypothetical protein